MLCKLEYMWRRGPPLRTTARSSCSTAGWRDSPKRRKKGKKKRKKPYFCKVKRRKIQRHGRKIEGKIKRQGKKIRMHPMWAMPATLLSSSLPFLIFHRFSSPALEFFFVLPYKNKGFSFFFPFFLRFGPARQPASPLKLQHGGLAG